MKNAIGVFGFVVAIKSMIFQNTLKIDDVAYWISILFFALGMILYEWSRDIAPKGEIDG